MTIFGFVYIVLGDGKYHLVDRKVRSVYSLAERVCTWRVVGLIEIDVTSIPMLLFHKHADGIHECCNQKKIQQKLVRVKSQILCCHSIATACLF